MRDSDAMTDEARRIAGRAAGAAALAAALAMVGEAVLEARGSDLHVPLGTAFNLLLIPAALWLGMTLWSRGQITALVGSLAGLGSLLLWAGAFTFGWFQLEVLWIALSAAWWLALAQLMRRRERRLAILTAVTGLAAALDATVTGIESARQMPFLLFVLLGGWKLPLQLIWSAALGVLLLVRGRL
jgi:hypothetical protein